MKLRKKTLLMALALVPVRYESIQDVFADPKVLFGYCLAIVASILAAVYYAFRGRKRSG